MKIRVLIFLLLLLPFGEIEGVATHLNEWKKSPLELYISSENDTIILGQPFYITARLTNRSKQSISIPKGYSVVSNLFPNGLFSDSVFTGGLFNIEITTSPHFHFYGIWVENLVYMVPRNFIKIEPGSSINYKIDFGEHINDFNDAMGNDDANDSFKIKRGNFYHLKVTYTNKSPQKNSKSFFGTVKSNEIGLFIK